MCPCFLLEDALPGDWVTTCCSVCGVCERESRDTTEGGLSVTPTQSSFKPSNFILMVQIFKLSCNTLSALFSVSFSFISQLFLSELWEYFIRQIEPKILCLVTRQESQHCIAIMICIHVTESVACARGGQRKRRGEDCLLSLNHLRALLLLYLLGEREASFSKFPCLLLFLLSVVSSKYLIFWKYSFYIYSRNQKFWKYINLSWKGKTPRTGFLTLLSCMKEPTNWFIQIPFQKNIFSRGWHWIKQIYEKQLKRNGPKLVAWYGGQN